MLEDKNRFGQSEMIAYVLLIIIAVAMSVIIYKYMSSYVPAEGESCPDDANLVIRSYACDLRAKVIYLELENKGLFTIDAFKLTGAEDNTKDVATMPLGSGEGGKGYHVLSKKLEPGDKITKVIDYSYINAGGNLEGLAFIEILPSIFDNGKSKFCSNARIKQKVVCNYDSSLVMWLKFDGTTYDSSKNYNNGNCNASLGICPTLVKGALGNTGNSAYFFNGSQYLTVLNNPTINPGTGNFTITMWVNSSSSNMPEYLLSKQDASSGFYIRKLTDSYVYSLRIEGSSIDLASVLIPNGKWDFLAFSVDRLGQNIYVYNGQLSGSLSSSSIESVINPANSLSSDANLTIGSNVLNNNGFNGTIDDVRIYNRFLSREEITKIYRG